MADAFAAEEIQGLEEQEEPRGVEDFPDLGVLQPPRLQLSRGSRQGSAEPQDPEEAGLSLAMAVSLKKKVRTRVRTRKDRSKKVRERPPTAGGPLDDPRRRNSPSPDRASRRAAVGV